MSDRSQISAYVAAGDSRWTKLGALALAIPAPTIDEILSISDKLGLNVSADDAKYFAEVVGTNVLNYEIVDKIVASRPVPDYSSRKYTVPTKEENPNNAWYVKASITETATGPLAGRTVAIKDSIPVAGLPMTAGSNIFDGYVPDFDAEVVRRILAAGGTIAGKAHCEYLCFSGSSHTSTAGRIENPWGKGLSAGGSSSGSASVVATGEADMALGADQAGSIRMPSSFSGIVGIKPTYGLVPYTGIAQLDASFDHVGPMTANVADCALLLSVIAGPDGVDERQKGHLPGDYMAALTQGVKGLRIGILKEGFEVPGSDPLVTEKVRQAAKTLESLGATLVDVSAPLHKHGLDIWITLGWIGMSETALNTHGISIFRPDEYPISLMEWARDNVSGVKDAPASIKLFFFIAEHVKKNVGYVGYAKGWNAARMLRAEYDKLLEDVDLLLMPATPMTALPLPDENTSLEVELKTSHPMAFNTAPFDISHHPALTLPAGGINGMPVGMMLVGRHFDEATIFRAAAAYEATGEGAYRR
ncbi:amidase [Agrobacterium sp. NPDC090273]|uniref:amidase n=1 Tax=Agrobacterium sp. NPDC090273 TaxID=3363919 RepID=UPI00383B5AC7